MRRTPILLIALITLYILHELGHVVMYAIFGVPFKCVIFPNVPHVLGIPHLVGFIRPFTNNLFIEINIRIVGPVLVQLSFIILTKREPKWLLGILFSYGDVLQFLFEY